MLQERLLLGYELIRQISLHAGTGGHCTTTGNQ
jgi:hypothetical protein